MQKIRNTRQRITSPDIADKYLQLKEHDAHGMLEDIAYVYPKGKEPVFTVNAYQYDHGNHTYPLVGLALLLLLYFPASVYIGAAPAFALLISVIGAYCAYSIMREKKRDFNVVPHHPEIAVFDNGIWFFRYHTFVPFERFFRVWVKRVMGLKNVRQVIFEVYLKNEDLEEVIERKDMAGFETFTVDKNLHHKTSLNDVLAIRLPYRDGGMDYTHDEIVTQISYLIKDDMHDNTLPVDIGIEKQAPKEAPAEIQIIE
ncbi:MAG: hypothetical protein ACTHOO_08520 [Alcanivorax sp.]